MSERDQKLGQLDKNFKSTTGWSKSRLTVVFMKNNIIINNNIRINCILHTHNCKFTFAPPCILNINRVKGKNI